MLNHIHFPYKQTFRIKQGKLLPKLIMRHLITWIGDKYGAYPLNIVYETPQDYRGRCPRLTVVFDLERDLKVIQNKDGFTVNDRKKKAILNHFLLLRKNMELGKTYDTDNLFVIFENFYDAFATQCMKKVWKQCDKGFLTKFSTINIWRTIVYDKHLIVFLESDANLAEQKDGAIVEMKHSLFNLYKKYDLFDYMNFGNFPVHFDTKQRLYEKYNGSFRAYFD